MRINAKNFTGSLIIMLFLLAASIMIASKLKAQEIPPELVMVNIAAIDAAQRNNALQFPIKEKLEQELANVNSIINASNETARTSREIICTQYVSYCTEENLNPQNAEIDLSRYLNGSFQ